MTDFITNDRILNVPENNREELVRMSGINGPWYRKLAKQRKLMDMTQEALAALVGVSTGTVGRWERGDHEPHRAYKRLIAQALQVEEDEIFEEGV